MFDDVFYAKTLSQLNCIVTAGIIAEDDLIDDVHWNLGIRLF
jgi:hypothetical protein